MGARICVVGAGRWGRNHIRALRELGALGGVVETRAEAHAELLDACGGAPVYASLDEALERPFDGYVIATPAETHAALATRTLGLGKATLVEKPLALCAAEGRRLKSLAQARGAPLMVGHLLLFHPAIRTIKRLIDEGKVGKLQYLYSNRLNLGAVRTEENILWSFAPHDVAVILRLVGSLPSQVVACGGSYVQSNVADVTVTSLLFDSGVRAHIHVSWLHPFKEQRLVVIGQKKMASFDDVEKKLVLFDRRVELKEGMPVPVRGQGEEVAFERHEPLRLECEAFLRAVATRRPPLTDGRSGLRVLSVLQAAQRSLVMNGGPVTLPIETFGAESMGDRP